MRRNTGEIVKTLDIVFDRYAQAQADYLDYRAARADKCGRTK